MTSGQQEAGGAADSQQQQQQQQQELTPALKQLLERTKYPLVQESGHRRYGPPPGWEGPPPPKGCEVFVGKIPRDMFEDELVPVMERAGRLYEMRLMVDQAAGNRGYGFVQYCSLPEAQTALRLLKDVEVRPKRYLGVSRSVDNNRLFVGGIPKTRSREEVLEEMRRVTEGVVKVILYPCVNDRSKNRGYAFVEYTSHKAAAMARRKLFSGRLLLWGAAEVKVDWAEPEHTVDSDTMAKVSVRRLPRSPAGLLLLPASPYFLPPLPLPSCLPFPPSFPTPFQPGHGQYQLVPPSSFLLRLIPSFIFPSLHSCTFLTSIITSFPSFNFPSPVTFFLPPSLPSLPLSFPPTFLPSSIPSLPQ